MDATARKEKLEELLQRVQRNRERLSSGSFGAAEKSISLPTPSEPPPEPFEPEPIEPEPFEPEPVAPKPPEPEPVAPKPPEPEPPLPATRRVEPSLNASRAVAEVDGEQAEQWTIRAVLRRARRLGAGGD